MRFVKNFLMSISAMALAAAFVALFAPHAVHAAVAALVEVSNPVTSPALTSRIDDPGRIPYQKWLSCTPKAGGYCNAETGPVPPNHRLVVESISGVVGFQPQTSFSTVTMQSGLGFSTFYIPLVNDLPTSNESAFNQPVHLYADQNQSISLQIVSTSTVVRGDFTITGYLLDCNAAPCAAITSF
jgi:hypothetical protein